MGSMAGRPGEDKRPLNLYVRRRVYKAIKEKLREPSRFFEKMIEAVVEEIDPGPLSPTIHEIDRRLSDEIYKAMGEGDHRKALVLRLIREEFQDFKRLSEETQQGDVGVTLEECKREWHDFIGRLLPDFRYFPPPPRFLTEDVGRNQ